MPDAVNHFFSLPFEPADILRNINNDVHGKSVDWDILHALAQPDWLKARCGAAG
jgi:hypothetical protein